MTIYEDTEQFWQDHGINDFEQSQKDEIWTDKSKLKVQHYQRISENTYGFVNDVTEQIPSGFYRPCWDMYNQRAFMEKRNVVLPNLYRLPNDVFELILNDIQHFWQSEDRYKRFGNVYKRNILLYSTPGNGKTSLINMLAFELINKHEGIVFTVNSTEDLKAYPKCVERVRMVEPNRKIITIIEDFDAIINIDKQAETLLLQLLDGNGQYGNIVTIATTNYPEQLKPSFTNRPSRFNIVLEYKKPDEKVRRYYITNKLKDSGIDITNDEINADIERYVKATKDFSFDYVKEYIQAIFVDELSEAEALARVKGSFQAKGKYKITESSGSTIGFALNQN